MSRRLAIAWGMLAACAGGDGVIDRVFDPCAPIGLDADGATAAQRAGVADAIALWGARGIDALADGPVSGATIPVRFEEANPVVHGYYDDETGVVYVNTSLDDAPEARAIVLAHELGHAFGLTHVGAAERPSLMNPGNLTVGPTDEDLRVLAGLWGSCPR